MAAAGLPVRLVPAGRRMTPGAQPSPAVSFGPDGLVPAVVQDAADGRVLMLAYMDAEALAATIATGEVHFHSRSRDRLWRKGETSGNVLRLVDLAIDCDGDALLVTVEPAGPTCHRGTRSCFDPDGRARRRRDEPGLRLARDAVGDDRRARRATAGRLVHGVAARGRRGCRRPQGHRGGDRGPAGGQGRRGRRADRRRPRRPRARRWPARPPTCCTTRSCCWPSGPSARPRSSTTLRSRHARLTRR